MHDLKRSVKNAYICCALLSVLSELWVGGELLAEDRLKQLDFPDDAQSLETVHRSIAAIGIDKSAHDKYNLVLMPDKQNFLIETLYNPNGKTREESFGKLLDSHRQALTAGNLPPIWTAVLFSAMRVYPFDGAQLSFTEVDRTSFKQLAERSVIWDLIKPARDRGGEPTPQETAALRAKFKRAFQSTLGMRLTGLARMPAHWDKRPGVHYLAASRLPGFPLLLLDCQADEPTQCVVARHCYLEGAADLASTSVSGIAISNARKLFIIGDSKRRRLLAFKYQSCFHAPATGLAWTLPSRLKNLSNLTIDDQDGLWVSTSGPDDYANASVYHWPAANW